MRLTSQKIALILAVSVLGCKNTSEPTGFSAHFILNDVNGRPVPTYMAPGPGTTTIVSGTVTLDKAGSAVLTEHRVESNGTDLILSANYTYEVSNGHITLDPIGLCAIPEGCAINGTISGGVLTLDIGPTVYTYRIAGNL